jgi:hypothetical protein
MGTAGIFLTGRFLAAGLFVTYRERTDDPRAERQSAFMEIDADLGSLSVD